MGLGAQLRGLLSDLARLLTRTCRIRSNFRRTGVQLGNGFGQPARNRDACAARYIVLISAHELLLSAAAEHVSCHLATHRISVTVRAASQILRSQRRSVRVVCDASRHSNFAAARRAHTAPMIDLSRSPIPVIAVGASAGGVEALGAFLAALPVSLPAAVMIVLHLPAHTKTRLHEVLARHSVLPIKAAVDGEPVQPGQVYVACADLHLMLDGCTVLNARGPRECRMRPAVNVLFRSVAESCGPGAIGVVLSGALDDGTAGLWALKRRGGLAFVQEPADAQYDSMPLSALEHVDVDGVGTAAELGRMMGNALETVLTRARAAEDLGIESVLAKGGTVGERAVFQIGKASRFACPECHGVLAEIEEGSILRFRCHTGHGYSIQTLAAEVDEDIDDSLWNAVRALEEKALLLERVRAASQSSEDTAQLDRVRDRLEILRAMLLSPAVLPP